MRRQESFPDAIYFIPDSGFPHRAIKAKYFIPKAKGYIDNQELTLIFGFVSSSFGGPHFFLSPILFWFNSIDGRK